MTNPYRTMNEIPFTRPAFWIRNAKSIILTTIITIVVVAGGGITYLKTKTSPQACKESINGIVIGQQQMAECPSDTTSKAYWGGSLPSGEVLLHCTCK